MMKHHLECVHGHSINKLEQLLQDSCDIFDSDVTLERESLGGWSNINIRGRSSGTDFVLKLPWAITSNDMNPYKQLYEISLFFKKLGIAALPLSIGKLSDSKETPFIIFEYVDGVIHGSLGDYSEHEVLALKRSLQVLSNQNPQGLRRYKSPSEHLAMTYSLVNGHDLLSDFSQELMEQVDSFNEVFPKVESFTDSLGKWSLSLMHGDLWVPNIVFRSGDVTLLDFEACSFGNHLYDLAYLLETPVSVVEDIPPRLLSAEDVDGVNNLRPLVLAYIVGWSLDRLLYTESGMVEPNIAAPRNKSIIIGYVQSKIARLKAILS